MKYPYSAITIRDAYLKRQQGNRLVPKGTPLEVHDESEGFGTVRLVLDGKNTNGLMLQSAYEAT